uniref:Putative secreted protein n=1 Tax=Ixodes ricinus TaxID=34613 RepID=A0A147BAI2_IXORI
MHLCINCIIIIRIPFFLIFFICEFKDLFAIRFPARQGGGGVKREELQMCKEVCFCTLPMRLRQMSSCNTLGRERLLSTECVTNSYDLL